MSPGPWVFSELSVGYVMIVDRHALRPLARGLLGAPQQQQAHIDISITMHYYYTPSSIESSVSDVYR